jgi:hypothetical protein
MNLHEKIRKDFQPNGQPRSRKTVLVPHIEAESEMGRTDRLKQLPMKMWIVFPDVFDEQGNVGDFSPFNQRFPSGPAPIQPDLPVAMMMPGIVSGMAHHLYGVEHIQQIEKLVKSKTRHLPDQRIDAPGIEVPKGSVKSDPTTRIQKLLSHRPEFRTRGAIEIFPVKTYFHIQAKSQDLSQVTGQEPPRHVEVNSPQKLEHLFVEFGHLYCFRLKVNLLRSCDQPHVTAFSIQQIRPLVKYIRSNRAANQVVFVRFSSISKKEFLEVD